MVTIEDAAHKWVNTFSEIPISAIEKLWKESDYTDFREITPPSIGDGVCLCCDEWNGESGEIVETDYDGESDLYVVRLCCNGKEVVISEDEFEMGDREYDGYFPIWGWMWSFKDICDEEWLNGEHLGPHLKEMANCGFRIYESEDWGIVFGIDGAGYDFFESHWIPLYKARGLQWHTLEEKKNECKA